MGDECPHDLGKPALQLCPFHLMCLAEPRPLTVVAAGPCSALPLLLLAQDRTPSLGQCSPSFLHPQSSIRWHGPSLLQSCGEPVSSGKPTSSTSPVCFCTGALKSQQTACPQLPPALKLQKTNGSMASVSPGPKHQREELGGGLQAPCAMPNC